MIKIQSLGSRRKMKLPNLVAVPMHTCPKHTVIDSVAILLCDSKSCTATPHISGNNQSKLTLFISSKSRNY